MSAEVFYIIGLHLHTRIVVHEDSSIHTCIANTRVDTTYKNNCVIKHLLIVMLQFLLITIKCFSDNDTWIKSLFVLQMSCLKCMDVILMTLFVMAM